MKKQLVKSVLASALAIATTMPLATVSWAAESKTKGAEFEGTWKLVKPQLTLSPANGGEVPLTDEGRKLYKENMSSAAKKDFKFDPTTSLCSSPGMPRLMISPQRIKFIVRPQLAMFLYEWNDLFRPIDLSGKRREPPPIGSNSVLANRAQQDLLFGTMGGKSYGHWEGNVLVIETDGLSDQKLIDNYLPNSEDLKLTEHIRLVDNNTLEDRITITDPMYFTKSWDALVTYKRQPDTAFEEYVCIDHLRAAESVWPH